MSASAESESTETAALLALSDAVTARMNELAQEPVQASAPEQFQQLAAVLGFVGEQQGAALVGLLAAGVHSCAGGQLSNVTRECSGLIRQALHARATSQPLPPAAMLGCWQRLLDLMTVADAHPCQLLSLYVDERELADVVTAPSSSIVATQSNHRPALKLLARTASSTTTYTAGDVERLLLDFLRAGDDGERRHAASGMASVIGGFAQCQTAPEHSLHWRALQAFAEEVAAGQAYALPRAKRILSAIGRQLRRAQRESPGVVHLLPPELLREALYEIACHPCISQLANDIARIYRLAWQFPREVIAADAGSDIDYVDIDAVYEQQLQQLLVSSGLPAERLHEDMLASDGDDAALHAAAVRLGLCAHPVARGLKQALAQSLRECVAVIEQGIELAAEDACWPQALAASQAALDRMRAGIRMIGDEALWCLSEAVATALKSLSSSVSAVSSALEASPDFEPSSASGSPTSPVTVGQPADGSVGRLAEQLVRLDAALMLLPVRPNFGLHMNKPDRQTDSLKPSMLQPEQDAQHRVADSSLRQIFATEAASRLRSLRASLADWESTLGDGLPMQASVDAHALAGSSATVGLPGVQALARELEQACDACLTRSYDEHEAGLLRQSISVLENMLDIEDISTTTVSMDDECPDHQDCRDRQSDGSCSNAGNNHPLNPGDSGDIANTADPGDPGDSTDRSDSTDPHESDGPDEPDGQDDTDDLTEDPELRAIFQAEAADLLPQLEQAISTWLVCPEATEPPARLMRVLHTLKGSARMAGLRAEGKHFHQLESRISQLVARPPVLQQALHELQVEIDQLLQSGLAQGADGLQPSPSWQPASHSPSASSASLTAQLSPTIRSRPSLTSPLTSPFTLPQPPLAASSSSSSSTAPSAHAAARSEHKNSDHADPDYALLRMPAQLVGRLGDTAAELLTDIGQQADEVRALRQMVVELADNLGRLRSQLRELEIEADVRISSGEGGGAGSVAAALFDPLEFDRYTRLHELTRLMNESVADLADVQRTLASRSEALAWSGEQHGRRVRALHADLQQAATLPFGSLKARLERVLRQAGRDLVHSGSASVAPEVQLMIEGAELAMDRSMLERLAGPLEHLVRNTVAHGIETADERERTGKPRSGRLRITLAREASQWRLEVADDGRGLDRLKLRAKAELLGVSVADEAELIFVRGLSTASTLTELSGRGVGMDAVRAAVRSLGGEIQVSSDAGLGCRFIISLPLSLAILPVLMCRAGPHRLALPATMVSQVLKLNSQQLAAVRVDDSFCWQQQAMRWRSMPALLGLTAPRAPSSRITVLLLSQAGRQLALQVDAVDARREVALRDPGAQLLSIPGMVGASPLADGGIALVMNPFALSDAATMSVAAPSAESVTACPPLLMVVDDSLTVRRASQRLLERQGYEVLLARDGNEAIALLTDDDARMPQAMLLDIEMPGMDGFELLSVLRGDARWQSLPVVMVSSRTAGRHRERALQLGASDYVGKPYREEALLGLLADLLRAGAAASSLAA